MLFLLVFSVLPCRMMAQFENVRGYEQLRSELLDYEKTDSLSEWHELILAIAYVESRYYETKPKASRGYLQITPIYLKEANNILRTKGGGSYRHSDCDDFIKSVEIFNAVNGHHNPNRDVI